MTHQRATWPSISKKHANNKKSAGFSAESTYAQNSAEHTALASMSKIMQKTFGVNPPFLTQQEGDLRRR